LDNNTSDFSSGGCYIYVDLKYKNEIYTVVTTNTALYRILKHQLFNGNLTEKGYKNLISKVIKRKSHIEINDAVDTLIHGASVRYDLIKKYDKIDILNKGYILSDGRLVDSINYEDEKAIIYNLLNKEIKNCCQNSETGKTIVF